MAIILKQKDRIPMYKDRVAYLITEISDYISNNALYWLDSSESNWLKNLVTDETLGVFQTGTSESPFYLNRTILDTSRRTFVSRVLTSDPGEFPFPANVQVVGSSSPWTTGKGFTIIRVKNTVENGLLQSYNFNSANSREFIITTNQSGESDIHAISFIPSGSTQNFIMQVHWGRTGFDQAKNVVYTLGTCMTQNSSSVPRVWIEVVTVKPDVTGTENTQDSPDRKEPVITWQREVLASGGNITCNGLRVGPQGTLKEFSFVNEIRPSRVFRNADNPVHTFNEELECIVFNDLIPSNKINEIKDYLKAKWNI
jgi:hypothetical protein